MGTEHRLDRLEERVTNMMTALRNLERTIKVFQQQVILLTRLEKQRVEMERADPVAEMKRRITRKTRQTMMERQVED